MKGKHTPFTYKVIETRYNGYHYRSRLEARWAVFFDTLDIKYCYEHEGYDLEGIWYLPDFWLPEKNSFVEIKPTEPTEEELQKITLLALYSQKEVYLIAGNVGLGEYTIRICIPPSLHAFPSQSDPSQEHEERQIAASSQVLHLLASLKKVDLEIVFDGFHLLIRPYGYSQGIVGMGLLSYAQSLQEQHDTLQTISPYLEQYQQEIIQAITPEEGWRLEIGEGYQDDNFEWVECQSCNEIDMYNLAYYDHINCKNKSSDSLVNNSPRLIAAYEAARQARFQRGGGGR